MHRYLFPVLVLASLSACATVGRFPNDHRARVSTEWVPGGALDSTTDYSGPEVSGLKRADGSMYSDTTLPDPEFHCVEPVTPALRLRNGTVDTSVSVATATTVTVGGSLTESAGIIYTMPEIVLLAQSQAFQVCLARMAGDLTDEQYREQLTEIRDTATSLVQAQVAGNFSVVMDQFQDLTYAEASCREAGKADTICDVYSSARERLATLLPDVLAAGAPAEAATPVATQDAGGGGGGAGNAADPAPGGGATGGAAGAPALPAAQQNQKKPRGK